MSGGDTSSNPLQSLKELFDQVDTDNDGRVTYRELWEFLQKEGRAIPKHVRREIRNRADRNDDGSLDYEEFECLVNDPEFASIFDKHLNRYMKVLLPKSKTRLQYSCWPPRICMIMISLIEIILFAIDVSKKESGTFGPIGWVLVFNPRRRREVWRFLTYMFVHDGVGHLLVNVMVQLLLGLPLEMIHKWWRISIVYFFGVLAGSLGSSVVDSRSWLAGASGGVYALITAHIASIILNWKEMFYPLPQLLLFLVVIVTDVGTSIYNRYCQHTGETVSYAAHFSGGLAGLLMGIVILENFIVHRHEKIIKYVSICVISTLVAIAVVYNFTADSHFPPQDV